MADTRKLMEYGLEHYEKVKVKAKQELETVPVINAADYSYDPDKEILMPVRVKGKDLRVLKDKEEKVTVKCTTKKVLQAPGQKRNGDRKSRVLYRRGKSSILSDRCDGKCIRKNATVVSAVRLRKVSVLKFVRLEKMSIQISEKFNKLLLKYCIKSNTISIAKFFKNFQYIDGGLINE